MSTVTSHSPHLVFADVSVCFTFQQQASVSDKDLAKLMRYVKSKSNTHIVSLVAKRARLDIVRRFSREAVADLVLEKLVQTHAGILNAKANAQNGNGNGNSNSNKNPSNGRRGF